MAVATVQKQRQPEVLTLGYHFTTCYLVLVHFLWGQATEFQATSLPVQCSSITESEMRMEGEGRGRGKKQHPALHNLHSFSSHHHQPPPL